MTGTRQTGPVREWARGEELVRERMNEPVRALNTLLSGIAPPRQIEETSSRSTRSARFQIVSNAGDYLVCNRMVADDVVATTDVQVAKPYLLRNSLESRAGITYTYTGTDARTADDGATTESQVVVPAWEVGDEIIADAGIIGGTGVLVDDVALLWLAREHGRAWAKVAE